MKMNKTSVILALTVAVFAFGPSVHAQTNTAGSSSTNSASRPGRRPGGAMSVGNQLNVLSEQLKLTDEQKPKVKALLEDQNKQMQEFRSLPQEERRPKARSLREEMDKKMKEILTPEQYKEFLQTRGQGRRPRGNNNGGTQ